MVYLSIFPVCVYYRYRSSSPGFRFTSSASLMKSFSMFRYLFLVSVFGISIMLLFSIILSMCLSSIPISLYPTFLRKWLPSLYPIPFTFSFTHFRAVNWFSFVFIFSFILSLYSLASTMYSALLL